MLLHYMILIYAYLNSVNGEDSITMESTGYRVSLSTSESLKCSVYYYVIDHILGELDRRFSKANLEQMKAIQACHPSSLSFLDASLLTPLALFYGFTD